jgi:serine/threonine-protein kinase
VYPQVFGKYVLEKELARGGMARVVLATLRGAGGFEKRLVVKQIRDELAFDQQFVRRFVDEAKTTVALSHPNIVPVYELGVEEGTYFLAMELVEGVSVSELGPLTPEEGAYIGVEVCRALDYAHRRMKVVHRDITPRNVMIDEEGQVKLIDFGIAAPALVAGHEILGSPGHMAPEQVDGGELGPPTDIFAVAVLLLEAWTGTAPFRRATPEECAAAVREKHPRPSDFDPRLLPLDEAIAKALSLDPKERQQEASELARSLRAFLQGADTEDIARSLGERVRKLRADPYEPPPPSMRGVEPKTAPSATTQTFAANADALRLPPSTRKLETEGPRTRPMVGGDTIATRPLTTPVDAITPAPPKRNGPLVAVVAVAALAIFAFYKSRAAPAEAPPPPVPAPIVSAVVSAAPSPPPPASVASSIAPAPSLVPSNTAVIVAARANLSFLGEPGTRVTVDGIARGACPVRLALEAGRHDVRFTFDPTGESRGEPVTVKSGESVTVRAEFTGATPMIRVQR